MRKARASITAGLAIVLTGCPLAMQDDYVVAGSVGGETTGIDADVPTAAPDAAASPGGTKMNNPWCVPGLCQLLHAQCGSVPDGCGGRLDCGVCAGNRACGVKKPNQCDKSK
jgi:hypothetical protein